MVALVSVVIPYYNRLEALEKSIGSVIQQSYRPLELILVNDGGQEFQLPLDWDSEIVVKSINLMFNQGPAAARNAGLKCATGKFVAFLDSDDLWIESKLNYQIDQMECRNLALTHTSYIRRDSYTGVEKLMPSGSTNYGILLTAFRCRIATPTVVFRRDLLGSIFFDSNVRVGEDILFWLSCCKKVGRSVGLNRPCCVVNVSSGSHFRNEKNRADSLEAVNKFLNRKYPFLALVHRIYIFIRKKILKVL